MSERPDTKLSRRAAVWDKLRKSSDIRKKPVRMRKPTRSVMYPETKVDLDLRQKYKIVPIPYYIGDV